MAKHRLEEHDRQQQSREGGEFRGSGSIGIGDITAIPLAGIRRKNGVLKFKKHVPVSNIFRRLDLKSRYKMGQGNPALHNIFRRHERDLSGHMARSALGKKSGPLSVSSILIGSSNRGSPRSKSHRAVSVWVPKGKAMGQGQSTLPINGRSGFGVVVMWLIKPDLEGSSYRSPAKLQETSISPEGDSVATDDRHRGEGEAGKKFRGAEKG